MGWIEQKTKTGVTYVPDAAHIEEFEKGKREVMPVLEREADRGQLPIVPVRLRPVKSPGIYEAEFGAKDEHLVLHFWPYGFHQAKRDGTAAPRFKSGFEEKLREAMEHVFNANRVSVQFDKPMGSFSVLALNWAEHQYASELAIQACERLHKAMGGS